MRGREDGSAAIMVVALLPLLLTMLIGVMQVGALREGPDVVVSPPITRLIVGGIYDHPALVR